LNLRMDAIADMIAGHSLKITPGDKVLVDATDDCDDLIMAAIKSIQAKGGLPFVLHQSSRVRCAWLMGITDEQLESWYESMYHLRKDMDCILTIRSQNNGFELADVPQEAIRKFAGMSIRLGKLARKPTLRTSLIRYPTAAFAQQCGMSTDACEEYFFNVCTMDYQALYQEMEPLKAALDHAGRVRILSPGTDISFSIEGVNCFISAGTWNIPDGETAMEIVRESVNGIISYNVPSNHQGFVYRDIRLTFKEGRVAGVEANDAKRMEAILDTDAGARYIGEFAIGVNPYIRRPIIDTLFDEKMAGSLHFTPGGTDSDGNPSSVHWDIVQSHMPEFGGGEIYLDGKLWRKDGLFVDDALKRLNPDVLLGILQKG
jgi:aminopeptidase